ncbi:MAG: glucose-6-phosphate isomerase family protein [Anaerorhabdus sp.]
MIEFGVDICVDGEMNYHYGTGVFGPIAEKRRLNDVRKSLKNKNSVGPKVIYSIAMDVGKEKEKRILEDKNLLFGIVTYANGKIDNGPIRSQGHVHAISTSCGQSTPEVYQIVEGEAIIYMQEFSDGDAGECYAVEAKEGDIVIVPPNWVHATINRSSTERMIFCAWCVRDFGFDYKDVRKNKGIAFFPYFGNEEIKWEFNENYQSGNIKVVKAKEYKEIGIEKGISIYEQFEKNPDIFDFVAQPDILEDFWRKEKICQF